MDMTALAQVRDFRHEAEWLSSFSALEIGLAAGVVVALLIILLLVRKMQQNSAKIQQLEDRQRGLQHSLILDHQKCLKGADGRSPGAEKGHSRFGSPDLRMSAAN